jgi:hypothetical protein
MIEPIVIVGREGHALFALGTRLAEYVVVASSEAGRLVHSSVTSES